MDIQISYGVTDNNIDITKIVLDKCVEQNIAFIPKGDPHLSLTNIAVWKKN